MSPTPAGTHGRLGIPGAIPFYSGKVRDVYELGPDRLLIVATDNLSAFDVVLPTRIPGKGMVLTRVSAFWFRRLKSAVPHHLISTRVEDLTGPFAGCAELLRDRFMIVKRTERIDLECVVRARLTGSGYKDYRATGKVAGVALPAGLEDGARLSELMFTPATKNDRGHDENITWDQAVELVGIETAVALRERSFAIFREAAIYAATRGVELVDTKFEFGRLEGQIILIDEILSPDSSRFWLREGAQFRNVMDKQYVRDYLETLPWDKRHPGPEIPVEMVERVSQMYVDAERRLTVS